MNRQLTRWWRSIEAPSRSEPTWTGAESTWSESARPKPTWAHWWPWLFFTLFIPYHFGTLLWFFIRAVQFSVNEREKTSFATHVVVGLWLGSACCQWEENKCGYHHRRSKINRSRALKWHQNPCKICCKRNIEIHRKYGLESWNAPWKQARSRKNRQIENSRSENCLNAVTSNLSHSLPSQPSLSPNSTLSCLCIFIVRALSPIRVAEIVCEMEVQLFVVHNLARFASKNAKLNSSFYIFHLADK